MLSFWNASNIIFSSAAFSSSGSVAVTWRDSSTLTTSWTMVSCCCGSSRLASSCLTASCFTTSCLIISCLTATFFRPAYCGRRGLYLTTNRLSKSGQSSLTATQYAPLLCTSTPTAASFPSPPVNLSTSPGNTTRYLPNAPQPAGYITGTPIPAFTRRCSCSSSQYGHCTTIFTEE
ncbi:hypothetical protein ABW21_db0201410 [Orbilia brochopaga]|nr:hypothetical protein ABW21_db0201410 [Drechslerella brochopaga]